MSTPPCSPTPTPTTSFGLDDLRTFNWLQKSEIPLYGEPNVLRDLKRVFNYVWMETQAGGGKPQLTLNEVSVGKPFILGGMEIMPLRVFHGELPILAYILGGKVGYVTDVSRIPDETLELLKGLDVLFLDAVRYRPHPTHYHMERAIEIATELRCGATYFVHLSHDYDHDTTNEKLPKAMRLAYDGMTLTV